MTSTSAPVLVYNRIDENRRNTLLLLPAFALLLLPIAYGVTQLLVPFSFYRAYLILGGAQARLNLASIEASILRLVLLAFVLAACFAFLGYFAGTYFVLRLAGGHRVDRREEPALWRAVENLCLGDGLPQPAVYVVESSAPNAFSAGRDPSHASLVVTRGLLRLLDERELSGVIAHELSHIGNRDTALSSLLAALVAMVRLPLDALRGFIGSVSEPDPLGFLVMAGALVLMAAVGPTFMFWSMWTRHVDGAPLSIQLVITLVTPLYAFYIGPAAATFLRKIILHQREFLADADAVLLTRDPEGLALALAKAGAATGSSVNAGVATAHVFFLDPLPRTDSWLDSAFPSHPPVGDRIALLARMGDGIPEGPLLEAAAAGTAYLLPSVSDRTESRDARAYEPGAKLRLTDARTPLYKSADGSSAVLADLDANVLITVVDRDAQFIRVRLADGLATSPLPPASYTLGTMGTTILAAFITGLPRLLRSTNGSSPQRSSASPITRHRSTRNLTDGPMCN
jgi:heat shock protein HtpX